MTEDLFRRILFAKRLWGKYMASVERLKEALHHREPDRVPLDLGGTVSGISLFAHRALCRHLGFQAEEVLIDRIQYLAKPASEILELFDIDTRYVYEAIPREVWQKDKEGSLWTDAWGVVRRFTGLYYDMVVHPLASLTDWEEVFFYPVPDLPREFFKELRPELEAHKQKGKAVIVNCIGSVFEFSWYLRGFPQFMLDLATVPSMACAIMDILLEFQIRQFDELLKNVGDLVDVVLVGDDLATQKGPLVSPETYRKYIKPRQKTLYAFIKERTEAPLFYHSCGAIEPLLPDLIEIGVDIINPVQVSAQGMDTKRLKKIYGSELTFWGGIDTQRVLPFGTPEEVREEVRRRIDDLAPGGGYVLCAVHNIQADVPPENIVALYEEALRYGERR